MSLTDTGARPCGATEGAVCAIPDSETRVEVLDPFLEERIEYLQDRSKSFQDAWHAIRASRVPVTIGTAAQLWREIPSSFRNNPSSWAGVTVVRSSGGQPGRAFVALQMAMIEEMAGTAQVNGRRYLLGEVDRLLIHEVYGHLAPMFGPDGRECSDVVRRGEARPCVAVREEHVATELAAYAAVEPSGV